MKNGPYELIVAPKEYPGRLYRNKYCYEHTYIWWKNTGNIPNKDEIIHHINGDKRDNKFKNLEKLSICQHGKLHHGFERPANTSCSNCEKSFRVKPWRLKNKYRFCSRKCIGLFNFRSR